MEVEITVRVRAIVPDGLHLPRLSVDKNLNIPLHYIEGDLPPAYKVGIDPRILTVQHAIVPSQGNTSKPLTEEFEKAIAGHDAANEADPANTEPGE